MTNYERLMQKIDIYRLANWLYMFDICPFPDKDCGKCKFYDDDRKNPPCSFHTNYDDILKWLKDEESVDKGTTNGEVITNLLRDIIPNVEIDLCETEFCEKYIQIAGRSDEYIPDTLPRTKKVVLGLTTDYKWWDSEVKK